MILVKRQINKPIDKIKVDKIIEIKDYGLYYSPSKISFVIFKFIQLNFEQFKKDLFVNSGMSLQIKISLNSVTPKKTVLEIELNAKNAIGKIYLLLLKRYFIKKLNLLSESILT
ncbi:MAG: hypothetical protein N3A71_00615 [Candidatus Dojkabacteria bacterium]|nr:hypothetical protein [Candidatus Dojkabacteria bacterium]